MHNNPLQRARIRHAPTIPTRQQKSGLRSIKSALYLVMLLLLCFSSTKLIQFAEGAQTRYVPGQYPTIQQAVNAAVNGDTIQVSPGLYPEHVVVPDTLNQLQIIGNPADPTTTIVDGTSDGTVFRLDGTHVTIKGFTARNAGNGYITISSAKDLETNDYHLISNNIIETSQYGIHLGLSNSNTITNNTIIDNSIVGIDLEDSDNNIITQNKIQQSVYGIKLATSTGNNINHNNISQTGYGIHLTLTSTGNNLSYNNVTGQTAGIFINADNNTIHHNTVPNSDYGIWLYNSKYAQVYYNNIHDGSYGIRIQWSTATLSFHNISYNKIYHDEFGWGIEAVSSYNNTFVGNWLQENAWGISLSSSAYNLLYRNNFINNSIQATTNAVNTWDKNGNGNHWSDHTTPDANGNGIVDTVYRITPGQDNYPLVRTWSQHDITIQSVTPSTNQATQGTTVVITVTAKNIANITTSETFKITAKYNTTTIGTQTVTGLAQGATATRTFNWDTSITPIGNYTIKAEATTVTDELNTDNNNLTDGTVKITPASIPGDINGDGQVNSTDLSLLRQAYGSTPENPNWNPQADLNQNGIVDAEDLRILGENYGTGL